MKYSISIMGLAASVQAQAPAYAANSWPRIKATAISLNAPLLGNTELNSASKPGGIYGLITGMGDTQVLALPQTLTFSNEFQKVHKVVENAAGALTFYGTKVDSANYVKDGADILGDKFGGAVLKVITPTAGGNANGSDNKKHESTNQPEGFSHNLCKRTDAEFVAAKCTGVLYTVWKTTSTDFNVVATGRLLVMSEVNAIETEAVVHADNTGAANITSVKSVGVNKDFILAASWQAQDDAGTTKDGTKYCWGKYATALTSTASTFTAAYGVGPNAKCTWHWMADSKSNAPVFEITNSVKWQFLIQAVEYPTFTNLGTNGVLNDKTAMIGKEPFYIGGPAAGKEYISDDAASQMGTVKGVALFNPIMVTPTSTSVQATTPDADGLVPANALLTNNAATMSEVFDNETKLPGSWGGAMYYQREKGYYNGEATISAIDSSYIAQFYDMYNTAVVGAYNAAVTAYNSDKTAYEKAVKDAKEAPDTKIPARPGMPKPPASYSGPTLNTKNLVVDTIDTSNDFTTYTKGLKGKMDAMLNVNSLQNPDKASVEKFSNKIRLNKAYNTANEPAEGDGQKVGIAFGLLGTGMSTSTANAQPFILNKQTDAERAGMMVSIFPTADLTLTADKNLVIKAMSKPAVTDGFALTSPSAAPKAIVDQALVLAASVLTSSAIIASLI